MERFPNLVIVYSEGQVGRMPYEIERADKLWAERATTPSAGTSLPHKPSSLHPPPHLRCVFDDEIGLKNRAPSGWIRSASRRTTRTPTAPSRTARRWPATSAPRLLRRGGDLEVPPWQRHPLLRPRALRRHQESETSHRLHRQRCRDNIAAAATSPDRYCSSTSAPAMTAVVMVFCSPDRRCRSASVTIARFLIWSA